MAWIALIFAGLLEMAWAFSMKQSYGFTRLWPTLLTIGMALLGTAYTIWTGIGAIGAFVVGIVFLGETASAMRIAAAGLIVSGLLMMKLAS